MRAPATPANERERQEALDSYRIVGTPPDINFDDLAALAAEVLDVPIALVTLIDESRQWFKARYGLDSTETPRAVSFCGHVVVDDALLLVPDARLDERFHDNPLVTGEPNIRFYAGTPLRTRDGFVLGTLCAIDHRPREFSAREIELLELLGRQVVAQLERHRDHLRLVEREAELQATEQRTKAVLETMVEGVIVQDADLAIIACNEAAERILGLSRALLIGQTSISTHAVHPDGSEYPGRMHPAALVLQTGEPCIDALMGIHKPDGELAWILVSASLIAEEANNAHETTDTTDANDADPLNGAREANGANGAREANGANGAVLCTFHDVTEHFAAEAALAAEQTFLMTLLENLPGTFIFVFGAARRVERVFGQERVRVIGARALIGCDIVEIGSAAERGAMESAAAKALAGETTTLATVRETAALEITFVPLRDELGHVTRAIAIAHDVTERNQLRERLARGERLVTTGTLAAGVGHEINNPLSYIMVNLDLAIDEIQRMDAESASNRMHSVLQALYEASEGTERIRKIVRGLRTFASGDNAPVPTDLQAAVELSLNISMHELRQRATVIAEREPTPYVLGDSSSISQVLVNLLVNAARAFPTADLARNRVTLRTGVTPDGRASVEVIDNGPGIAPEVLPRIFDPFFTTSPVGKGTGLGLWISHNLVTALGGELLVRTRLGEGTTFQMLLPATHALTPAESPLPPGSERPTTRRGHVLVVDDEPNIVAMMKRLLKGEHDVVAVTDAREALDHIARDRPFDVVFCDLMMPHLSGVQFYERVAAQHPELLDRIVFVTGGVLHDAAVGEFLARVPNIRVEKPFAPAELRTLARRYRDRETR